MDLEARPREMGLVGPADLLVVVDNQKAITHDAQLCKLDAGEFWQGIFS